MQKVHKTEASPIYNEENENLEGFPVEEMAHNEEAISCPRSTKDEETKPSLESMSNSV